VTEAVEILAEAAPGVVLEVVEREAEWWGYGCGFESGAVARLSRVPLPLDFLLSCSRLSKPTCSVILLSNIECTPRSALV